MKRGDKVEILSTPNKGIKGVVANIDENCIFGITIKTDRGHHLYGCSEKDLKALK